MLDRALAALGLTRHDLDPSVYAVLTHTAPDTSDRTDAENCPC